MINHLRHPPYKNEHTEMKYLNITHKNNRILNVMNKEPFKIKKDFKSINIYIDDMVKFSNK